MTPVARDALARARASTETATDNPPAACILASLPTHSADIVEMWHGSPEPVYVCGYHASRTDTLAAAFREHHARMALARARVAIETATARKNGGDDA